jgi:thioredoxin
MLFGKSPPPGDAQAPGGDVVKDTTTAGFAKDVIEGSKQALVLVDFWAEWCAPCRRLAPIVDQIADQYADRLTVAKMDIDKHSQTPAQFMIRGIPTLLLFKDGKVVDTIVGLVDKNDLSRTIDKHL